MTTPQSILHDLHYQLKTLTETLNGKYDDEQSGDLRTNIEFIVKELGNIHFKINKLDNVMQLILESIYKKEWNKAVIDQKFTEEDFKRNKDVQR